MTSSMLESAIAGLVVVVAFGWVAYAIWRAATGKGGGCGSGRGGGCCGGGCGRTIAKPHEDHVKGAGPSSPEH